MAHVRFKTTIELDVEVVGHYTGETPARGMMGPPDESEPGESEDFEVEAVLLTMRGPNGKLVPEMATDVLAYLTKAELDDLAQAGCERAREQMEDAWLDQQIAREEARRDSEEDR